jgi:NTP pyrophosphatase (non-canonical NTP hydrolase)
MLQVESTVHTDEANETPWAIHPERAAEIVDAHGATVATFEVRHHLKGVLGNCDRNADLAVRAVNAYKKRGGADIRQLQDRITRWADSNFPQRTTPDVLLKLYEEVGEYCRNPKSALEMGDILILLFDVAHLNGIDVHKAVEDKMDINEKREWEVDVNTRIMRHVEPK